SAGEGETHSCQRRFLLRSSRPACICSKSKLDCPNLKATCTCSVPAAEAERTLSVSTSNWQGSEKRHDAGSVGGGRWDGMHAANTGRASSGCPWPVSEVYCNLARTANPLPGF